MSASIARVALHSRSSSTLWLQLSQKMCPNFSGAQTRQLSDLEAHGDDVYLWRDWDLDHGVCSQFQCADGARELYVRFGNDERYQSNTYTVSVELDTEPPELSSSMPRR